MKTAEAVLGNLAGLLWGNWMLFVLLGLGAFYTIATGGIQFRSIPWIIKEFCKKEKKTEASRDHKGTVSSVQALYMAIASCVGSGNIVGVATALIGSGPGALFWMWAAAFLGMATKYAEIVLGLVFRQKGEDGSYYGGPMYYIEKGLHARTLGVAAAVLLFFQNAGGTLIQSNTISDVALQVFGIPKVCTGIFVAAVMVFIIGGGLKRLADVAQKIVPVMASLYIVGGVVVVFTHMDAILPMLKSILQEAWSMKAGMGAAAGLTMKEAMRFGVARGLYSNEAGEGSAAVIHSAAQVDHPARQGFYGVVEVFADTMVICSTTGFSILASGVPLEGASATSLAAEAFGTVAPPLFFKYVVSVSLILFASTSIMSQWYFGHVSLMYIKSLKGDRFYRVLFPVLILLGSLSTAGIVWSVQDCMLGLLIIPNVLALLKLSPMVVRLTGEFFRENHK
ncbi:MAG: amino acid carrier protein [Clostridia bacterium]|nr:amino acid carrier protein [Clostridia bacterium]